MAISFIAGWTAQNNKVSSVSWATPASTPAGVTTKAPYNCFLFVVFDNLTATTPTVTSVTSHAVETGTWAKVGSFDSPQSGAAGGLRGELWRMDSQFVSLSGWSNMPSVTLSGAVTAKAMVYLQFTGVGALSATPVTATGTSSATVNPGTHSIPGQALWLRCAGTENNAAATVSSGSTITTVSDGTTGGSAVTNVWASIGYSLNTGSLFGPGSQTLTLTDGGLISAVFLPIPDPVLSQDAFRFYAEGTESGSTPLAAQDTVPTVALSGGDVPLQLRVRLQETNVGPVPASASFFQLQWEKNASGTWNTVATNLADSYEVGGTPVTYPASAATAGAGQSFIGNGQMLTQAQLQMRQTSGAGNMRCSLYSHTGEFGSGTRGSLLTTVTRGKNTLGASYGWESWDFDGTYLLEAGTPYFIVTSIIDGSGTIDHLGNTVGTHHGNAWASSGGVQTSDLLFRIYTTTPTTVRSFESTNLTGEAATTNRLTGGTGTFSPGEVDEDGIAENVGWSQADHTELLFSIQLIAADLAGGDTLRFRVLRNGAVLGTYAQVPTLSMGAVYQASGTVAVITDSTGSITRTGEIAHQASGTVNVVSAGGGGPRITGTRYSRYVRVHTVGGGSSTLITMSPALAAAVSYGELLVMLTTTENNAGSNNNPYVVSIAKPAGETNDWTILPQTGVGGTTAGTGMVHQVSYIRTTTNWASGFVATVTLSAGTTARTAALLQFTSTAAAHTGVAVTSSSSSAPATSSLPTAQVPLDGILLGIGANETTSGLTVVDTDIDGGMLWTPIATQIGAGATTRVSWQTKQIIVPHDAAFTIGRGVTEDIVSSLFSFAYEGTPHPAAGVVKVRSRFIGQPTGGILVYTGWPDVWGNVWTAEPAAVLPASGSSDIVVTEVGAVTQTHVIANVDWALV